MRNRRVRGLARGRPLLLEGLERLERTLRKMDTPRLACVAETVMRGYFERLRAFRTRPETLRREAENWSDEDLQTFATMYADMSSRDDNPDQEGAEAADRVLEAELLRREG